MSKKGLGCVIAVLVFFVGVILFFSFFVNEEGQIVFGEDYARITAIDYTAEVLDEETADWQYSGGRVRITERLTFDIHAASESNPFWELWRDLPESIVDGVKVEYNVLSVRQVEKDGQPMDIKFEKSPKLYWYDNDYINTAGGYGPGKWFHSKGPYDDYYNFECVLFYVDGLYRETCAFEIEYEMHNAALRYGDCSELYLSLYSESTVKYLNSVKGQIKVPIDKMPSDGNYIANTFGTNSETFEFTESKDKNPGYYTFSFELDKSQLKFRPYNQYIEFTLVSYGADMHKFTQYASHNYYYNDSVLDEIMNEQDKYLSYPKVYLNKKLTVLAVLTGISALVIGIVMLCNATIKRKYKFYRPSLKTDLYREIPGPLDASFAAVLAFCKHKISDDVPDGYAAAMLGLTRKGYIDIDKINGARDWEQHNIKIVIKDRPMPAPSKSKTAGNKSAFDPLSPLMPGMIKPKQSSEQAEQTSEPAQPVTSRPALTPTEQQYYNLILRHSVGNEVALGSFQSKVAQDYDNTYAFARSVKGGIKSIGMNGGYFQEPNYKKLKNNLWGFQLFFVLIGLIIMLAANLISYQTRLGLAFGAFFVLGGSFVAAAVLLQVLFRKYVLLTQFGEDEYIKWRGLYNFLNSETLMKEKTVIDVALWEDYLIYATAFGISKKVLKALNVRFPNADINSQILRNPYFRSPIFYIHTTRTFRTATRTASYASRSGGWGGYGGGGRGGGGGGGGH